MARNRFHSVNRPPPTDFPAYPRLIGAVSSLDQDDPSATRVGPTATIVTSGMPAPFNVGDLVVVHVFYRGNPITVSVATTGGQNWIKCAQHLGTTNNLSAFFCRFNGTWTTDPVFTVTAGTESMIALMQVWRSLTPDDRWALDQPPLLGSGAGTGFTITGTTPLSFNTVAIAAVSSIDDNNWINTTPGLWRWVGKNSYRTQGGTDGSLAVVGLSQLGKNATGPVTLTESLLGADAGITMVLVFKAGLDFEIGAISGRLRAPRKFVAGRGRPRASPRAYTDAATGVTVQVPLGTLVLVGFDPTVTGGAAAGGNIPLFMLMGTGN